MEEKDTIIFSDLTETIDFKALKVLNDIFDNEYPIWYSRFPVNKYRVDINGKFVLVEFRDKEVTMSLESCDFLETIKYPIKKREFYKKLLYFRVFAELRI